MPPLSLKFLMCELTLLHFQKRGDQRSVGVLVLESPKQMKIVLLRHKPQDSLIFPLLSLHLYSKVLREAVKYKLILARSHYRVCKHSWVRQRGLLQNERRHFRCLAAVDSTWLRVYCHCPKWCFCLFSYLIVKTNVGQLSRCKTLMEIKYQVVFTLM